ncbi:MAG: cysteine desulfurase [Bdellovibrionaceae bacterium]|nr:cysteine desulfurase [Pseudobdellovibrionaceae bacterium]MDW8189608.1 cysteine desulfurase family protein [Pseudobdellovibrionaceae bacterium]
MIKPIYLDHNATTPLLREVQEALIDLLGKDNWWGNPSSIHWAGRRPKELMRLARQQVAQVLKCSPLDVVFTSGATESNNTVIRAVVEGAKQCAPDGKGRYRIISSAVEHPSVLQALQYFSDQKLIEWISIPLTPCGEWDWEKFEKALNEETLLVSVMAANNETGVILPVEEIARRAKQRGALFHSDVTQAFLKVPLDFGLFDYASLSGHKVYALKGVGVLFVNKQAPFRNLLWGGSQERSRRAGTENVLAIASLGFAIQALGQNYQGWENRLQDLRDYFEEQILSNIGRVTITHRERPRLPNTSHIRIEGIESETLLMKLDLEGFAVSAGSACSSGRSAPSATLLAMGLSSQEAQSSLRVSLGIGNTKEQIDSFVSALVRSVEFLRKRSPMEVRP